jgi:hypothetical protein
MNKATAIRPEAKAHRLLDCEYLRTKQQQYARKLKLKEYSIKTYQQPSRSNVSRLLTQKINTRSPRELVDQARTVIPRNQGVPVNLTC